MYELKPTSRGNNWEKAKSNGAIKLGMENPNQKNKWMLHQDGHPDAGLPNIPEHYGRPHIHSINSKNEEIIVIW